MVYRRSTDYEKFACLAGKCPDTCCGGWNVGIEEESLEWYASMEGELGKRIRSAIDWEEECFIQKDGHCVLMDKEGLCPIHRELGGDALPDTCREYPRHVEEYENVREYSLSLSCPEAARMLLEKEEKMSFYEEEDESGEEFEEFDQELFGELRKAREVFLKILQNRNVSVETRINTFLRLASELQNCVDEDKLEEMEAILENFREAKRSIEGRAEYDGKRVDYAVFYEMDWLRPQWGELVEDTWKGLFAKGEEEYGRLWEAFHGDKEREERLELMREQLLTAYVDLYVCGAVYDGELFSKTALAVFCTRWIEEFLLFRFSISEKKFSLLEEATAVTYRFAREVEHSDNNLLLLEDWAKSRIMVQKI